MAQEISKVSQAFIAKVDAAIEGGVKKAADTKEEYTKLGEMLSGCKNEHETAYIQEKMKEYDIKYKLGDLRSRASEFVQKTVDNIKSRFKPKKALDREEAKSLVDELRRAVEENRTEDAEYIREELHQAGFDDLVKEFDEQQEKMFGKNAEEPVKETDKTQDTQKSTENGTTKDNEKNKGAEAPHDQPNIDKPRKKNPPKSDPIKPKEPPKSDKPNEPEPAKPEKPAEPIQPKQPTKPEKAHIDEASQARGYGHADNIAREAHDVFVNGGYIRGEIHKVDRNSTFSFVGKLKSQMSGKVFENIKEKVTYKEMVHVAANLLNQAKDLNQGLEKTQAWKNLKAEFDYVNRFRKSEAAPSTPADTDVRKMDNAINALYNEMNKVIEK